MQPVQRVTIWRRLVQIAALAVTGEWLVTGLTRCPFAVPFVSCTACPLTECPGRYLPVPAIGVALLSALLAGRVFCGWACPMGFVEDLLGRIPKLKALTCPPFARVERWLKPAGYAVVLLVVYLVVTVHLSAERPYPYVVRSSSVLNLDAAESAVALGAAQYRVRLWILVPVLVLSVLVTRFWCRYLCPLGAVLGVFNRFSWFAIRWERQDMPHCGKYPRECIQHTTPGTSDCVLCGECMQGCPRRLLSWRPRTRRPSLREVN